VGLALRANLPAPTAHAIQWTRKRATCQGRGQLLLPPGAASVRGAIGRRQWIATRATRGT